MREAKYSRPITIAMSEQVFTKIKEISDTNRVSMAEVMRVLLYEGLLKREEKIKSKERGGIKNENY